MPELAKALSISIKTVVARQNHLNVLLEEYQELFTDELGTIKPFKARLAVDSTAEPRFHRPRSVPFAMRSAVEEELDCWRRSTIVSGLLPLWPFPKRMVVFACVAYKVTVNPVLSVDQYPLPRPTDRSFCHSRRRKVLLDFGPFTCIQPNSA